MNLITGLATPFQDVVKSQIVAQQKADAAAVTPISHAVSTIDPSWAQSNPDKAQAEVTRAQWEYSKNTFLPLEQRVINKVTSSIEPEAQRAGAITRKAFESSGEVRQRNLSRKGVALTKAQKDALARREDIAKTKAMATAENVTRRDLQDRNRELLGSLAGLGKGIASGSASAFSSAADAKASREATGKALDAQKKQSQMSAIGTGAGIGFAVGGPVGAGIGAGVGLLAGLF